MEGIVVKSTGSWITVMGDDGETMDCKLKGTFRIKGIKSTNPVAVGDRVDYVRMKDEDTGLITVIHERHNYIVRKSTKLSKVTHILAANVDQVMLIATMAYPRTSTGFIDRFLVTAEAYHIPTVIAFNKADLCNGEKRAKLDELAGIYSGAGYVTLKVSGLTGEGIDEFTLMLKDKVSLLAGHSGVGKSTLINRIEPGLDLKVKEVSSFSRKGQHATTFAEMHRLSVGGFIIDTPGIREFGLINFDRKEVAERFPEMRLYMHGCKYNNCTHIHEPGCAVKKALEEGKIHPSRYENYLRIFYGEDWLEDK